ncbi:MAG: hypothetical protein RJB55_619, partial [Verrucomicrobiota bacterium]
FDSYLTYLNTQLQPPDHRPAPVAAKRAVTISRQSGCGSHVLAEKLAGYLQARTPPGEPPWTIFDRNLMEEVLAEHHLPAHIAKYMPEDRVTEIADIMDELFGLRPASWALVEQTAETILHLAEVGNVILLGRGANLVTAKSPGVVHVRLIAPLETRVAHMQQFEELSRPAAAARVRREDLGRRRYINKYFQKDVDDPLLYHLVINTDSVPLETAARLIGELVLRPTAA